MLRFFLIITVFGFAQILHAQTTEGSVKATVNQLFAAMKNADANALQQTFADSAILQTIISKNGKRSVETEAV